MRRILLALVLLALLDGPALAADASTAWMTNPQHNGELTGSPLRPPLAVRWDIRLGTVTSNVLVADGRVIFVRADATGAPQLTAVDAGTGAHLWSVLTPAARIAYEGGRVFATQGSGIAAFAADSGARLWTRDLQADYGVPHVVADGGTVFALLNEPGSKVAAVRAGDGGVLWTSTSLSSGDSAPTLDAQRVYVGFGGGQTYALDRATGQVIWHHDTGYSGGGGTTAVLHGGRLYAEAWTFKVLDPATGGMIGSYVNQNGGDHSQPAFAGAIGIFRPALGLVADGAAQWSFAVPAQRPITAGGHAYTVVGEFGIDDPAGVVAIDLSSGTPVWCADLGIRAYPDGHAGPVSGGNGLIVVPVDDRLVAYGNGGTGSTCGGASAPAPAPSTAAPPAASAPAGSAVEVSSPATTGPRITLRAARTKLILGQRTRLTGVVSGVARAGGQRVRIEADDHPFGRFRTLARVRTRGDGTYRVLFKPARNVRLRAVLEGRGVRTPPLTVWAELPAAIRRFGAGGQRPRVRVTLVAPPRASVRARRVFFYLATAADTTWRRVDAVRWKRRGRVTLTATASFPAGRLGAADRVLVCTREPRPDPYGEPLALDRSCGADRLPR